MARTPRLTVVPTTPWSIRLLRDNNGRPYANLANVLVVLHNEPALYRGATFDELRQKSIVSTVWPAAPDADPVQPPPHETSDDDIARLQQWLQHMGLPRVGHETVGMAVEVYAREHRFHPIKDWLDFLEWDKKPRLDNWLFTYLGAKAETPEDVEYVTAAGRMFLIAMVNRVYKPGCQCDYMLVLEGEQGALKSSACRVLAGEFFSDSLPDIHTKDASLHLRGKWLVEHSELTAVKRAGIESLKAFLTRTHERYRPPYGRHDVDQPRQCVFVGTTNEASWLKDPTGGRRFWPVVCLVIDVERLAADRDQLFAEAVFRRNERHWPTAAEEDQFFKPQQEARREDDPWQERVAEHLENTTDRRTTIGRIATVALGFESIARVSKLDQLRIASVLQDLGWKPGKRTKSGRWYVRGDGDAG